MNNQDFIVREYEGQDLGVCVTRPFAAGEFVMFFNGERRELHEISDFTHYLQISPTTFLSPTGSYDDYVNHSCDPNCALYFAGDQVVLRALRDIEVGEQLSFDYGTIMFSEPTTFPCSCESANCRGFIGNYYTMPYALREEYKERGMVLLLSRYTEEQILAAAAVHV